MSRIIAVIDGNENDAKRLLVNLEAFREALDDPKLDPIAPLRAQMPDNWYLALAFLNVQTATLRMTYRSRARFWFACGVLLSTLVNILIERFL